MSTSFIVAASQRAADTLPAVRGLLEALEELRLTAFCGALLDAAWTLVDCAELLQCGRQPFLVEVRQAGVAAGHAQRLANGLSKMVRAGRLPCGPPSAAPAAHPSGVSTAKPSARVSHGAATAAAIRAALNSADVAELSRLVGEDAPRAREALSTAAADGAHADLLLLLRARADPECVVVGVGVGVGGGVGGGGGSGRPPLLAAACEGHAACVAALLAHGASVDDASPADGSTALIAACRRGHAQVAHACTYACMHVTSRRGHAQVALALLEGGAAQDVMPHTYIRACMRACTCTRTHTCTHACRWRMRCSRVALHRARCRGVGRPASTRAATAGTCHA